MGNVNMEAYQIHCGGDKSLAEKLTELDAIAQQIGDLPTFTSDDRAFLEAVPAFPAAEGKTVLTATTDDQGETELTYETPEVEQEDIAPAFSEDDAYSAGALVYYEGNLYKFTADHTAGAWDPSEVTTTSAAEEFNELKNTITNVAKFYTTDWGSDSTTYGAGINSLKINLPSSFIGYNRVFLIQAYDYYGVASGWILTAYFSSNNSVEIHFTQTISHSNYGNLTIMAYKD